MKNITTEQKIIQYINAGFFDKKPRLTTREVVEYANSKGANWIICDTQSNKRVSRSGMTYSTGGGSKTYSGYRVRRQGEVQDIFDSTETYRNIGDLIDQLPNYYNLTK